MKAKTAKFLAVLAVLAMAFAAVAVFAPVESDADEVQSVWTTPAKAEAPAQSDPWSLKLGTDAIIPTDGQTIDGEKVYYVNSDMSLVMADDADLSVGGTLIMLKSGVHVSVQVPQKHEKTIAYAIAGVDESKDKDGNTILTFYGNYSGSAFQAWVGTDNKGFHFPTKWTGDAGADNNNTIIGNQTIGMSKAQGGGNFEFESGVTVDGNEKKCVYMAYTDTDCAWYLDFGFFAFNFQYIYQYDEPGVNGSAWNMMDAYGAVGSYGEDNKLDLNGFTGVLTMKDDGELEITKWIAGDITVTKGSVVVGADATIPAGSSITFANGVTVPNEWTVSYKRFVVDEYTFTMTGSVKAGAAGLTITAGMNGLELSGAATVMTDDSNWTFAGAAEISGILNMDGKKFTIAGEEYQITLRDFRADNARSDLTLTADTVFESQVTVSGGVKAEGGSMIVAPFAFVNITGKYDFAKAFGTFVGKDATLRVSTAYGPAGTAGDDYTASDKRWADVAFVDVTGKFFLNQNLVTTTSGAVITYLYQVGEGLVSVNSSICATYSEYYLYKQVIPYLLLNPVDVVCTSLIAEQADITLKGVDYTGGELPIGNQARYTIDYTTGVPELTVIFKELYPVEIQNAYANGVEKIEVIDDENNKVFMEPKTGESTTGIVKLAYTYDYIIKGVNENNKYTFYFDVQPTADDAANHRLNPITLYSSEFTMVRGYMTYATVDTNPDVPHFITYEEGLAVELTVILDEEDYTQYSEGDVFMYFTTEVDEKGKPTGEGTPVVLSTIKVDNKSYLGAIITKGLYSTDTVFFKSEHRLFYKLTAVKADSTAVTFPSSSQSELSTVDFSSTKWSSGFGFASATTTKATLGVDCGLDEVEITFVLPEMPSGKKVYVDFSVYCNDAAHKVSEKIDTAGSKVIKMCVGEVYAISWDDIDGKFVTMMYDKTSATEETANPQDYIEETPVIATSTALKYTLKLEDIKYIIVENNTSADLTLAIGKYSANIEANKANNKVIVNDGKDKTLILSKKGYTVEGWDFNITYATATTTDTAPSETVHVSGPQTINTYNYYDTLKGAEKSIKKITILGADIKKTLYSVEVQKDDHAKISTHDQNGYMGEEKNAYVTPQSGYIVVDVEYRYQEVDDPEIVVGHAEYSETKDGEQVWSFVMPASDVLLKPIVYQETREVTFKDQYGETVETKTAVPGNDVSIPVPCSPLYTIVDITSEIDFEYNEVTGYVSFEMPDANVVFTVTYEEIEYSEDVAVAITKTNAGLRITVSALDGFNVLPGEIKLICTYWYYDEEDDVWDTESVTLDNVVAGESIVTSCLFAYADLPAETDYVQAIYDSPATDGDSGMIVY